MKPDRYEITKEDDEEYAAFEREEREAMRMQQAEEARLSAASPEDPTDLPCDQDYEDDPDGEPVQDMWFPLKSYDEKTGSFEVEHKDNWPSRLHGKPSHDLAANDLVVFPTEDSELRCPEPCMDIPDEGFMHIPCFTSDDFADLEPQRWLVDEVLPAKSVGLWWGAPQSGKTAVLIDLAFSVAFCEPWGGRVVEGGRVLIISLEGHAGFKARVRAAESRRGESLGNRVHFVTVPVNVMKVDQINAVARLARKQKVNLIVIDTLAASLAGEAEENSNKDMTLAMHNAKLLVQMTGATVVITHHTGRDPNAGMERGASALRGNVDTSIKTSKSGDHFTWEVVKQRDGPLGIHGKFKIVPYEFSPGGGDELIKSIVVDHIDPDAEGGLLGVVVRPKPKGNQTAILAHLKMNMTPVTGPEADSASTPTISLDDAVNLCKDVLPSVGVKHRTTRIREVLRWLICNGYLIESDGQQLTLPDA